MIGQACGDCRRSGKPSIILVTNTKRPYWPTKIIAVHREISHSIMNIPIFRETVSFANFSGGTVAIGSIVPLYKRSINHLTDRRVLYRSLHLSFTAKNCPQINLNDPAFSTSFMNSGISQAFCRNTPRTFGTTTFAGVCNCGILAVSLQNGLFIRSILIRGNQIHNVTTGSFLKIKHKFLNVFRGTFAWYNTHYQTMLRVVSYMVPVVPLSTVLRDIVITVLSFLTHKCPFLIELNLSGFRGKTLPTHREVPWHVCRQVVNNASQYFYLRQPDALFCVLRSLQKDAQTMRLLFSHQSSYETVACLFVRKTASCMFGNIAVGYGYFCRIFRILSDYLRCVFHNPGIFYSGNVGIGTTNPSQLLEVQGSGPRILVNATASNPEVNLRGTGKTEWAMYQDILVSNTGDLRF